MMKFITNFEGKKEWYYRRASELNNLSYEIKNEAYTMEGKLIDFNDYKAFYVDASVGDLSDFWRTFEELKSCRKLFTDVIECTNDVIMEYSNVKAFTKGVSYKAKMGGAYYIAINNQGEEHCVGFSGDKEHFFSEHFIKC